MWALVRAFGIFVGIATLLRLALNEKLVTYDPLFQLWLDKLRDIVELGFLTDLLGPFLYWAIEQVRSLGISVPDLQDEWRPAFVLSMLVLGAAARSVRTGWFVVAAPCLALACAVWAGLTGNLFPFAVAGTFTLMVAIIDIISRVAGTAQAVLGVGIVVANALVTSVLAIHFPDVLTDAQFNVTAPTLSEMLFMSTAFAAMMVSIGIWKNWGRGYRAALSNPAFNTGLDILGTMLGALFLASWFSSPPIW